MRIFLTGATGFVGTFIRRALVQSGHQVIGLAHHPQPPEEGITWVPGDISDTGALIDGIDGAQVVVHLVGIIEEKGEATFSRIHVEGTEHVLAAMRHLHISRLLHMSALGASSKADTEYFRTKWKAEEAVRASGLDYTIFRPAIIFGPGDGFVNLLVRQICRSPIIPVIGAGEYPLALISIHAVAAAFVQALQLNGTTVAKTFELCGPETLTYNEILKILRRQLGIHRPRIHLPVELVRMGIRLLTAFSINPPITRDQMVMLLQGSVCDDTTAAGVFDLPRITLAEGIKEYVPNRCSGEGARSLG
ncbi:MAG: complex I NDUFA9 subunit family protein [Armatimonadota bacterium]